MNFKQIILAGAVLATSTFTSLTNVHAETGFRDVPSDHWSYKAIMDLKERNIFAGYGNGIFGFGDPITRGQVARLLYAYLQPVDDPSFKNPFNDVKGTMFEKEILAIVKAGIMNGYGNSRFGPDDILTREQLAAVLKQAFNLKTTSITTFKDVEKNYWATNAISALQENKIVVGTGNSMFEPKKIVTREQYAQFLYNTINKAAVKPELIPFGIHSSMITNDFSYDSKNWNNASPVLKKSVSNEAQNLITKINKKYNENYRYASAFVNSMGLPESVQLRTSNPNLGRIYDLGQGQFFVEGENEHDFYIMFIIDNATVELAKNWVPMINANLNLDNEINNAVTIAQKRQSGPYYHTYIEKDNYKIELGVSPQTEKGYDALFIGVKRK
ncbi:S-layer homology domain-containing protein [Bacillus albus]|uniref:S-layer homology domain-containing protein n=1 Tax=Bacillus albus TaxID=2026189 RepID=UPI00234BAA11|nr:S-layer homology domain-containing protein [Bacillus albus]MDC6159935.1 S-layer homology domain-containing protein [Bacillus albus]MDD8009412.1 S-layer homology domain-containing protein [Bacillus albus]